MPIRRKLGETDPGKLFLIDSLGGLLSAAMLGFVLARFERVFGMPQAILYALAFIALTFSLFSFLCFVGIVKKAALCLKIIAIANLLYCCFTTVLVVCFYQEITVSGLTYFVLEVVAIVILALVELKTADRLL